MWLPDSPKADEHAKRRESTDEHIRAAAAFAVTRAESTNPFETDGGVNHKHALASVVLRHGHRLRERVVQILCGTGRFAACTGHPEADHRLGLLAQAGIVQVAISLDTDMAVHLAETDALWVNKFPRCMTAVQPKPVAASLFPAVPNAFLWMFCLMGCDYTCGLKGFGYKTSKKTMKLVAKKVLTGKIDFGNLPVRLHAL